MKIVDIAHVAQRWNACIEKLLKSANPPLGEMFGLWQLAWVLNAAGADVEQNFRDAFLQRLRTKTDMSPLEQLQRAWMQQNGLPGASSEPQRIENDGLFARTLMKLVGKSADAHLDDSDLMTAIRLITGIPEQHAADLHQLMDEVESARPRARLSLMSTADMAERINVEAIRTHLKNIHPELCSFINIVALPPSIATPMSWRMNGEQQSVYLGWPENGLDGLHAAEQWALLAHELTHIRSQLSFSMSYSNHEHTLFSREFEALQQEWQELNLQVSELPSRTAEDIKNRWRDTNGYIQLQHIRSDILLLRQSYTGRKHDAHARETTKNKTVNVRLPLAPFVYALSVRLIDKSQNQRN